VVGAVTIDRVQFGDLAEILREFHRFWGDREAVRALHHPMFFIEFADTALVARNDAGEIAGYLLGFIAAQGNGYIHLVAVRDDARGSDVGRRLYERFFADAAARGATAVKAITSPDNQGSIAFHRRMGFSNIVRIADYGGGGQPRVVMRRALDDRPRDDRPLDITDPSPQERT
jgi:ribosomal protein S18 acetylase RimI-like enzyme